MKIGILTHPLETNNGGTLQAFALQKTLLKMGHEVLTIDRHDRREYPSLRIHVLGFLKRNFEHYIRHKNITTAWNPFITDEEYSVLSAKTQRFIDKNIRLTRKVYSDELARIDEEYLFDSYVVGSDQVWLDPYCPNSFLDFVSRPNVRKLTYAASCDEKKSFFNNERKVITCKELAKGFSAISVREKQLVDICKEKLDVSAKWVLDPTLLLTPEEYMKTVSEDMDKGTIIFSYILDNSAEKRAVVSHVSKTLDLPFVDGNLTNQHDGNTRKLIPYPSTEEWLNNVNRARFVVTDSFHGTVFAILFNKPFITIVNSKRGANRFKSLLGLFGLESRMVLGNDVLRISSLVHESIDFNAVNQVIDVEKEKSLSFLTANLS